MHVPHVHLCLYKLKGMECSSSSPTTMEVSMTDGQEIFHSKLAPTRRKRVHEEERQALISIVAFSKLSASSPSSPARLTIWRKSLLFNGNGYTVYDDTNGRLVFRVDNYASDWKQEAFLMDFAGNVLFTIRRCRKKLGLLERWEAFRGDMDVLGFGDCQKPFIRATKALGNPCCKISAATTGDCYQIIWSRKEGWSRIYRTTTCSSLVAEVNRKCGAAPDSLLSKDVLTLIVQPGLDQAMIMAMVMINDAMR